VQDSHAVLIVTDDAAFARDLVGRWQAERTVPGFTVMSTELFPGAASGSFDLAIVGPLRHGRLPTVLKATDAGAHPVICLLESAQQVQAAKAEHPRLLVLQQHETWLDSVPMLAAECLRRVDVAARLHHAEKVVLANSRTAVLGRYMLENRHDFSNLLTSVLGNAELLLDDSHVLPELARDQIRTIHATALHMHGIMQRFSSLATEMQIAEKESHDETPSLSGLRVAAS
jgi:signal transduction histidine kinase